MANSIRVTELDEYKQLLNDESDMFLLASNGIDGYKSYKLSFGQLYAAIRDKISAEFEQEWKNPSLIQTSAEVLTAALAGNNISAVGAKPVADVLNYCTGYLANNLTAACWS